MMAGVPTEEAMAAASTTSAAEEEAAELAAARERIEVEVGEEETR
jgi:hypothetical protein